jgi:hypothetical protein
MAIGAVAGSGAVSGTSAIGGAGAAGRYRRYDQPRDGATAARGATSRVATPQNFDEDAALPTPARMLASLIDRMGGAPASRVKGSFVNLRV